VVYPAAPAVEAAQDRTDDSAVRFFGHEKQVGVALELDGEVLKRIGRRQTDAAPLPERDNRGVIRRRERPDARSRRASSHDRLGPT
jgi:hypothetical protein